MSKMFYNCNLLEKIIFGKIDSKLVKDMSHMFSGCKKLKSVEINNINTSSVLYMNEMFKDCSSLKSLDLNNFNTSKVLNMSNFFYNCNNLKNLNLRQFETNSVTDMSYMFYSCSSLNYLNLSKFDTSNVINMKDMFGFCMSLISLNLSNFRTSFVENMGFMFIGCQSLTVLNIDNFDTSSVTTMEKMFYSCNSILSLDLNHFNTSKVTDMYYMFYRCNSLKILNIDKFNTSKVFYMDYMFYGCYSLISLNLLNFKVSSLNYGTYLIKCGVNTTFCINETEFKEKVNIPSNIINNCSDFCFNNTHKIISENNKCIDECINDNKYQYEYKNLCYSSCPFGTYPNNYTCQESLICENYYDYNHSKCFDTIPEGYYLNDSLSKTVDRCHINCKTCKEKDNENNNNCLTCINDLFLDFGNCVSNCTRGYFNDSSNNKICKCKDKKKCNSCSNESLEMDLCITCDNDGGFYEKYDDNVNKSSFIDCFQKEDGYYIDNNILKPCYKNCKECYGEGNENMHNCKTCIENYTFINDSFYNEKNCYPKCEYYYYFDINNNYFCTLNNSCPDNYKNLIIEKNKCIYNCSYDNIYIYEYNNTCYDICPNGTHNTTDSFICEKDLICEKYYNYTHDGCLDYIPQGYYLNDSSLKTIDKCNNKCSNCSLESNKNDLCISCNNNGGFYQIINDSNNLNQNDFVDCDNSTREGYYLDTSFKAFKPCYMSCKKCDEIGNISDNKCTDCYQDYFLENGNCYKNCTYYHYFDFNKIYNCTENNECPNQFNNLIVEKKQCIDICKNDNLYKYQYKNTCYIKCPKGTISNNYICKFYNTSSTLENWNIEDFFSGNYNPYFGEEQNSEINDKIINSIREDILNGNIDLTNLTNGSKSDLLIQLYDTYYQITSSDNQNNNQYSNLSSINLGECENILKEIYKIDKNLPLIIFKVDYFKSDSKVPVIGYEIFHPITKEKLDTTYCKDELINFNIPVSIDENNLFKYDPNNDYYTDKCISYSSDGKDMLLNDRQNEFNNNNMSLCENSCEFIGYEKETKKAICECEMKYQQLIISNISTNSEIFYNNFSNNNVFSNTMTMKCYYTLFTKDGLTKNIGSYIFIFIIALFITTGIFYYKCGHRILEDDMCEILKSKEKDEKSKSTTIIKSSKTKKKIKIKIKEKNL